MAAGSLSKYATVGCTSFLFSIDNSPSQPKLTSDTAHFPQKIWWKEPSLQLWSWFWTDSSEHFKRIPNKRGKILSYSTLKESNECDIKDNDHLLFDKTHQKVKILLGRNKKETLFQQNSAWVGNALPRTHRLLNIDCSTGYGTSSYELLVKPQGSLKQHSTQLVLLVAHRDGMIRPSCWRHYSLQLQDIDKSNSNWLETSWMVSFYSARRCSYSC